MDQPQIARDNVMLTVGPTDSREKRHFAKSYVYSRRMAWVIGTIHILLTVSLGVSILVEEMRPWMWNRHKSAILFALAIFAITGVTQIFTAFYPGSITVGCLLGLSCFSAVGDFLLLMTTRNASWCFAAVESLVILSTFVVACRALCGRTKQQGTVLHEFTAIPGAEQDTNLGARARNSATVESQQETPFQAPPSAAQVTVVDPPPSYEKSERVHEANKKGQTEARRNTAAAAASSSSELTYAVAVSNRLFTDGTLIKDLPCLYCRWIEMGEMACYTDKCPKCGRPPPIQPETAF